MPARLALTALLALALAAAPARRWLEAPSARPSTCAPTARGSFPRHWLGCAADPGTPGDLRADERLALGLPIDPNTASARELAFVPGLSRRLAEEVVAERRRGGAFRDLADLLRVRGIGPRRLARAAPSLAVDAR